MMKKPKKLPRSGMKSEFWICPHDAHVAGGYGYYIAERFYKSDKDGKRAFWLLSGRMECLSKYQAEHAADYRRSLGEEINIVWADGLPDDGFWLNLRHSR